MNFLSRLEKLRLAQRMTVREVHAHLGVSPSMISMIRNGSRQPGIKLTRRLEQAERSAGIFQSLETGPPETSNDWKSRSDRVPTVGKVREGRAEYGSDAIVQLERIAKKCQDLEREINALKRSMKGGRV